MNRYKHFDTVDDALDEVSRALENISQQSTSIVYLIRCDNERSVAEFKRDAGQYFDGDIPKWAWAAHYSDYCLYVGATTDLHSRFVSHCFDDDRGAKFTGLFPPKWLAGLRGFQSTQDVFNSEVWMAGETEEAFRQKRSIDDDEEVFVYQS